MSGEVNIQFQPTKIFPHGGGSLETAVHWF